MVDISDLTVTLESILRLYRTGIITAMQFRDYSKNALEAYINDVLRK